MRQKQDRLYLKIIPAIPERGRLKQVSGQPELNSEFQASQNYNTRLCLRRKRKKKIQTDKQMDS